MTPEQDERICAALEKLATAFTEIAVFCERESRIRLNPPLIARRQPAEAELFHRLRPGEEEKNELHEQLEALEEAQGGVRRASAGPKRRRA